MTASDTPRKRVRRGPKLAVASSLRRVRNKDLPPCCTSPLPRHPATEAERVERSIDSSLADAQKTIATMVTDAVRQGCCCDHVALYMLQQQLVGRALTLTRRQRQARADVP